MKHDDSSSSSLPKAVARYETSLFEAASNCKKNYNFDFLDFLKISTKSSQCMLGIDEAGRGPVLGPMVYSCALSPINRLNELKTIGLADSKALSEKQREKLLEEMLSKCDWISAIVHVISPVYITEKMLDKSKTSLNVISQDSAIQLIQSVLDSGINLVEVKKYDSHYPVTKSYLRACMDPVFGFPSLVRSSWSTASSLLDQHGVSVKWEDDETHEEVIQAKKLARKREHSKGTCKLSNFFNNAQSKLSTFDALKRQPFFVQTGLVHVQTIT
ncbi:unnamed protein product [Schistosoma turkestanicum]|nr:unnamed protein product [Schistosoma turkestanicum]